MSDISKNDRNLMSFLQKEGSMTVAELSERMGVTETAVRQRLNRLSALGLISRDEEKLSRGRPVHKYSITREGRATAGENFSDLTVAVWDEVRSIPDKEIRSQVIRGIAQRLAEKYRQEIEGLTATNGQALSTQERAQRIARFFESRGIPVTVNADAAETEATESGTSGTSMEPGDSRSVGGLPVLRLHGCPYPGLAERDELICEMEQTMFSALTGCEVELNRCDRHGQAECCTFQLESVDQKAAAMGSDGNEVESHHNNAENNNAEDQSDGQKNGQSKNEHHSVKSRQVVHSD